MSWGRDDYRFGGFAENCPQNGNGHHMNTYSRHSADPSWVAACLICYLYSGGSHAGAHSCPESEEGFCGAIANWSSISCPPGRKFLQGLAVGGWLCMHVNCCLWRWVVHSCPPGSVQRELLEEDWKGYCQMLLTASCEFKFATCIELRACLGWGFMCMKVAIYLLYMQLLPLLCAQTL